MGRMFAALVAVLSLAAGGPTHATEEEIEPDPLTTQGYNDGENGFQTVTMYVRVPDALGEVLLKVAGDCEFTTVGKPNTNQTFLFAVAHASTSFSGSHGIPVSTGVTCRVRNRKGGIDIAQALPLANVAGADVAEVNYGEFKICITVSVHYNDDHFARSREVCRLPILPG